jgi:hypothetical protein
MNARGGRKMGRGAGRFGRRRDRSVPVAIVAESGGRPSPVVRWMLRGFLHLTVLCVACSGRVSGQSGSRHEATAIAREALSRLMQGQVAALPQWDPTVPSYNNGDQKVATCHW